VLFTLCARAQFACRPLWLRNRVCQSSADTATLSFYAIVLLVLRGVCAQLLRPAGIGPPFTRCGACSQTLRPTKVPSRYAMAQDVALVTMGVVSCSCVCSSSRHYFSVHALSVPSSLHNGPLHALHPVVLPGLFTLAMLTEQLSSIIADQTGAPFLPRSNCFSVCERLSCDDGAGIERLKHEYVSPSRSWMHNLSETFGRPFSLLWFLPTTVCLAFTARSTPVCDWSESALRTRGSGDVQRPHMAGNVAARV
jgi:hypothetical protein